MTGPRIGSLFSGYGGLDMGVQAVLGGEVVWHVEYDAPPSKILAHHWPEIPNHGDVTKTDWATVEPVDVLTGGFPCQDVSLAGLRRGLKKGTRSGLWSEFARAIDVLRPALVVIENVRGLLSASAGDPKEWTDDEEGADGDLEPGAGALGESERDGRPVLRAVGAVLGDLADLGYDARWRGVRAADAGAPHGRFRVFILAWPRVVIQHTGHDAGGAEHGGRTVHDSASRSGESGFGSAGTGDASSIIGGDASARDADIVRATGGGGEQSGAGIPAIDAGEGDFGAGTSDADSARFWRDADDAQGRESDITGRGGRGESEGLGSAETGPTTPGSAPSDTGRLGCERSGEGRGIAGIWGATEGDRPSAPDADSLGWERDSEGRDRTGVPPAPGDRAVAPNTGGGRPGEDNSGGRNLVGQGGIQTGWDESAGKSGSDLDAAADADHAGWEKFSAAESISTELSSPECIGDDAAADAGGETGELGAGLLTRESNELGGRRSDDDDRETTADSAGERRGSSGQASPGGDRSALNDQPAPNTDGRRLIERDSGLGIIPEPDSDGGPTADRGESATDADSTGFGGIGRLDAGERDTDGRGGPEIAWGPYEPSIRRWESVLRRSAPAPTIGDGRDGAQRLSAIFVEWMMGLPEGHVTGVGLTRTQELKALGNGVVPQQAALAVAYLVSKVSK